MCHLKEFRKDNGQDTLLDIYIHTQTQTHTHMHKTLTYSSFDLLLLNANSPWLHYYSHNICTIVDTVNVSSIKSMHMCMYKTNI